MREEQQYLSSKLLAYESNAKLRDQLKAFCNDCNLKGVIVTDPDKIMITLQQNINIGAILFSNKGSKLSPLIYEINKAYPEIPLFIHTKDTNLIKEHLNSYSTIGCYKTGDFDALRDLMSCYLFNRVYPETLVSKLKEIALSSIASHFRDIDVICDQSFIASDKRIFGERIELMTIRSNWCEGIVMLQTAGGEIQNLILANRTVFAPDDGKISFHTEDLLRELMNQIWGAFKQTFVPDGFQRRSDTIEVPMTINHLEKYISFGATDPLLCFKFIATDSKPDAGQSFDPVTLYLKFSFHLHWNADQLKETDKMQEMVQTGVLEFF